MVEQAASRPRWIATRGRARPMQYSLTDGQLNGPAEREIVDGLSATLGFTLPPDYLEFLREHDGGEGFVGDNYIILWGAGELADFNREYEVETYAPGIFLFGSDGGGEGYGFDTLEQGSPIVRVPFIGMERRYATPLATNLLDLFALLAR